MTTLKSSPADMNPNLERLNPYPFQRLTALLDDVQSESNEALIAWSMGEPKHDAPDFLVEALQDPSLIRRGFGTYPPTKGTPELRSAIAAFIDRRFKLTRSLDPETSGQTLSFARW